MITSDLMYTLAWSLVHFLWQGAAIAALAAAVMFVFRAPATRYLIGVGALALMLASFVITFSLLSGPQNPSEQLAPPARAPAAALASPQKEALTRPSMLDESRAATSSGNFLWVARGWLAGVFVLALRIALGLLVIEHLRRRNLLALPAALVARFERLQARLGLDREVRYRECRLVPVPAVIGFFRPIVLLPMRALTGLSPEQLEAVIAHELAHIQRLDVAVNFFQVVAETLFFFHPAVWWLNKRIRADREDCCDDVAVAACGSTVGYARALATMEDWRGLPNLAMAATGSPIAARVARLLGIRQDASRARTAGVVTASLVLTVAVLAGAASLGLAQSAQAQTQMDPVALPPAPDVPAAEPPPPPVPVAAAPNPPAPPVKVPKAEKPKPAKPPVRATPATSAEPTIPANPAAPASPVEAPAAHSYINEMRTAIRTEIDVEDIVALKVHDVSPKFVEEMRNIDINVDTDAIIAMKVHSVTPQFAMEMRGTGFEADADQLIAMKVHNVTPEYVQGLSKLGLDPNTDDIIGFKVHDVSPEFVKQMRDLGFEVNAEEIMAMKVHGVSPEYVGKIRAAGIAPDADEIIAMKVHGVTPEYAKTLERAGFKVDVDQLIQAKVMGVDEAYIEKAKKHGFKNLTIEKLVALKNADIL